MMKTTVMLAAPLHGLTTVIDMTWDRRDRLGDWLVVERGNAVRDGYTMWTCVGRLVATSVSMAGARNRAGKARAKHRRYGTSAQIDVVRRGEVSLRLSGAPYGCSAGEVAA